jgi:hypothetical protein
MIRNKLTCGQMHQTFQYLTTRRFSYHMIMKSASKKYSNHRITQNWISGSTIRSQKSLRIFKFMSSVTNAASSTSSSSSSSSNDYNSKASSTTDFLSDHGGKIGIVALFVSTYLIGSYFYGIHQRNVLEDRLRDQVILEPIEINELRGMNHMSLETYHKILSKVHSLFMLKKESVNEHENFKLNLKLNYSDIIELVNSEQMIQHGHLIDRLYYSLKEHDVSEDKNEELDLMIAMGIIALTISIDIPANNRLFAYYSLCQAMSSLSKPRISNQSSSDYEINSSIETSEKIQPIDISMVENLIQMLIVTNQLPPEKCVMENEEKYPYKTYRKKTAHEMVSYEKCHTSFDRLMN